MTASLIIGISALVVVLATVVSSAVTILRLASTCLESLANQRVEQQLALKEMSEQHNVHLSGILDRFQAIRWEDLAAIRSIESDEEGGFYEPQINRGADNDDEEPVLTGWGPMRSKGVTDEEQKLLDEDFES